MDKNAWFAVLKFRAHGSIGILVLLKLLGRSPHLSLCQRVTKGRALVPSGMLLWRSRFGMTVREDLRHFHVGP